MISAPSLHVRWGLLVLSLFVNGLRAEQEGILQPFGRCFQFKHICVAGAQGFSSVSQVHFPKCHSFQLCPVYVTREHVIFVFVLERLLSAVIQKINVFSCYCIRHLQSYFHVSPQQAFMEELHP